MKEIYIPTTPEERKKLVHRARERLLYALDRRLHSERELREKLYSKYPEDIIDSAIEELTELGLIDDFKFALAFAQNRKEVKNKGPYLVKSELLSKGVDRETADEAIKSVFNSEDDEIESAKRVLEKYRNVLDSQNGRQKAYAALIRKGYSYSTAKTAFREFLEDEE